MGETSSFCSLYLRHFAASIPSQMCKYKVCHCREDTTSWRHNAVPAGLQAQLKTSSRPDEDLVAGEMLDRPPRLGLDEVIFCMHLSICRIVMEKAGFWCLN